jgi:hypothetical protein
LPASCIFLPYPASLTFTHLHTNCLTSSPLPSLPLCLIAPSNLSCVGSSCAVFVSVCCLSS